VLLCIGGRRAWHGTGGKGHSRSPMRSGNPLAVSTKTGTEEEGENGGNNDV